MFSIIRLILLLIRRPSAARWVLLALGIILLIVGLGVGIGSHQVAFRRVQQAQLTHYIHADTTDYMTVEGDSNIYVVNETDFSPNLTVDSIQSKAVSFVYRPDQTTDVDVTSKQGTHLVGSGYTVIQLVSYNAQGQDPLTFSTTDYNDHPTGFYENDWGVAAALIIFGLLALAISVYLIRYRKPKGTQLAYSGTMPAGMVPQNGVPGPGVPGQPYPYGAAPQYPLQPQPQANPYPYAPNAYSAGQSYPIPTQYQQPYGNAPQYPPYPQQPEGDPYGNSRVTPPQPPLYP